MSYVGFWSESLVETKLKRKRRKNLFRLYILQKCLFNNFKLVQFVTLETSVVQNFTTKTSNPFPHFPKPQTVMCAYKKLISRVGTVAVITMVTSAAPVITLNQPQSHSCT